VAPIVDVPVPKVQASLPDFKVVPAATVVAAGAPPATDSMAASLPPMLLLLLLALLPWGATVTASVGRAVVAAVTAEP
jgi:hypothetical protein